MMQVTHAPTRSPHGNAGRTGALWFGFLCGPLAALTNEAIEYVLVSWSCGRFDSVSRVLLHVVPAALIAVCAIAALVAWHARAPEAGRASGDHQMDPGQSNRAFMAVVGVGLSALGALVILSQWIPVLYVNPCVVT